MEYLEEILSSTDVPALIALLLGVMTAISPCPLATNITATAYISKEIESKRKVFWAGVIYTLGRVFSYTLLGVIIYFGASKFQVSRFFQANGEKYLGPLLVIIGILMLGIIKIPSFGKLNITQRLSQKLKSKGLISAFLLGVIFALAFCPYSGVLYFGMLIPLTISGGVDRLLLPVIFAVATGIPVIILSYLLAYGVGKVATLYNKLNSFEKWFRRIVGAIFIIVGIYYILIFAGLIEF